MAGTVRGHTDSSQPGAPYFLKVYGYPLRHHIPARFIRDREARVQIPAPDQSPLLNWPNRK